MLTGIMMFVGATSAWAEHGGRWSDVFPPGAHPYNLSYPQWAGKWAEWIYPITPDKSPFLDPDGQFCNVDQSGPVFFLGSNLSGTTVRSCTVRPGQSVLFSPGGALCILGLDADTVDALRSCVTDVLPTFINVAADVDGVPVRSLQRYSFVSPLFEFSVKQDNIFDIPAGSYQGIVGGYFLIHAPFGHGRHVIHFHDEAPDFDLVSDVTYVLTVSPDD
jgi:hypothetical protein